MESLPYVRYNKPTDEYKKHVADCSFANVKEFGKHNIQEAKKLLFQDFAAFSVETLIKCPTGTCALITDFIKSSFNDEVLETLANSWPPLIKAPNGTVADIFYFFTQMIHDFEDSAKLFRWICYSMFPHDWPASPDQNKPHIVAFSEGTTKNDSNSSKCWVFVFSDKTFAAFIDNEGHFQPAKKEKFSQISVSLDDKSVSLFNNASECFAFKLRNEELICFWSDLNDEESNIDVFSFFNMQDVATEFPYLLTDSFASFIVNSNCQALRSMLSPKVTTEKDIHSVLSGLLDVFIKENRVNLLYGSIVSYDLEKFNSSLDTISLKGSMTSQMMSILVERFSLPYYNKFISKLIKYIDSRGDLGLGTRNCDVSKAKVVFFSAVKYILGSIAFFPKELSHFLSFVRLYSSLLFNQRIPIFNLISTLFFDNVLIPSVNGSNPFPQPKTSSINTLQSMIDYISIVFKHQTLTSKNGQLEEWEKRIKFKLHPQVDFFLSYISECSAAPSYTPLSEEQIRNSSHCCISLISNNFDAFEAQYIEYQKNLKPYGTTVSWNFGVALTMMFPHAADGSELEINAENMIEAYRTLLDSEVYRISDAPSSPFGEKRGIYLRSTPPSKYVIPPMLPINSPTNNKLPSEPPIPVVGDDPYDWKPNVIIPKITDLLPAIGSNPKPFSVPEGGLKPNLLQLSGKSESIKHKVFPVIPSKQMPKLANEESPSLLIMDVLNPKQAKPKKPKKKKSAKTAKLSDSESSSSSNKQNSLPSSEETKNSNPESPVKRKSSRSKPKNSPKKVDVDVSPQEKNSKDKIEKPKRKISHKTSKTENNEKPLNTTPLKVKSKNPKKKN